MNDVVCIVGFGAGTSGLEDPALVAELARRGIALDVCPTSNLCLSVYPSLAEHPLARLHAAGVPVPVTVNSDDPPLFGTTLNQEVALLADPFGLDVVAIDEILLNAVRHSFLPAPAKHRREASYIADVAALKLVHV
jgi:adenosine deaminase